MAADQDRLVVVGGSAGALKVLQRLVGEFTADFPADILAVIHLSPHHPSTLPATLARLSRLPVAFAETGTMLGRGRVFLAPPNHHLLVRNGMLTLSHGPKENLVRPAIDPLFRTAAASHGPRVVGVVLSGRLDDGTTGLRAVKRAGGIAVVQDPADAEQSDMPQSALDFVDVDHVVPAARMAVLLDQLVRGPVPSETAPAAVDDQVGEQSPLTCPECGGVLWIKNQRGHVRLRCHTGHVFTTDSMNEAQGAALENALWIAVRIHHERVGFARDIITRALRDGNHRLAEIWQHRVEQYERDADVIQSLLLREQAG